uniref:Putative radical SAM superfamily protein n=1 Tax=viral metagenome TaxID=1070528 RepID=A0A6M3JZH5_9ZZZZ
MKIARVFPTKTNMIPVDQDAYTTPPLLNTPFYDEVHISCQFTWDIQKAKDLAVQWRKFGKVVKLGGVALEGESDQPFIPGMYLRKGITITTRGCPNNCGFCMVRKGGMIEFDDFPEGNIIQDNNILACSDRHWRLVMSMLKKQKEIEFKGGLDKFRLTTSRAHDLGWLRIKTLWLACDQPGGIEPLRKAVNLLLRAGFTRSHLYCYVLIGDNARENIYRLKEVYRMGCMPFAQLFRNPEDSIKYPRSWKRFQRRWSRSAIVRKRNKSRVE